MPLSARTCLGPYQIPAPIGTGGMGEVYKARNTRLERLVAVKVSGEEFFERFECEARAISALNQPNLCQPNLCKLYDVGPNYLVMEYVDGRFLINTVLDSAATSLALLQNWKPKWLR
jgi:serine/threonine protein kinase